MKGLLIVIVLIISGSGIARADHVVPSAIREVEKILTCNMLVDTVPLPAKATTIEKDRALQKDGKVAATIKTLPVPRRQAIPVPVKVKVVPVKIKAPKIVKPIIKLLP